MRVMLIAILLAISSALFGQISTNEASARLKSRLDAQRAAATQPAKIAQAELESLKKEMAQLKKQVADLLADNEKLRQKIAELTAPPQVKQSKEISKAFQDNHIIAGMSVRQVEQILARLNILMNHRQDEILREGKRVVVDRWEVGGTYQGFERIVAEDGTVVLVEQ